MFSTANFDVLSFDSNWKKKFSTKELTTQTDTYKIVHRGLNIKKYRTSECQTDSYLFVEEDIQPDIDESDLNDFIKRVSPKIIEVLLSNERTCAFNQYHTNTNEISEHTLLHIIENKTDNSDNSLVTNISQLSWNCKGTVLAAAFGDIIHNKWCVHTNTGVGIFSLSTRTKSEVKDKPDLLLETSTCAISVQFHYSLTSLIVAGTHNGEIVVWDRSRPDNDLVLATNSENKIHQEAVNTVMWMNDSQTKNSSSNFRIISMTIDGSIVVWNLSMRKSNLTPINCYNLTARDLPKSIRYKGHLSKSLAIFCGTLNPFDNECAVVGIEVGVLFICQIKSKNNSAITNEINEIKSPVESILSTISGAVHAVQFSKVIPNFLVAVAASGTVHIYNIENKQQVFSTDTSQGYIYDLSLSALLQGIIATSGENGTILLTDILEQDIGFGEESLIGLDLNMENDISKSDFKTLKCENKNNKNDGCNVVNCVEFNNVNVNILAASDLNGTIYIWNLDQQFTEKFSKARFNNLENSFSCFKTTK